MTLIPKLCVLASWRENIRIRKRNYSRKGAKQAKFGEKVNGFIEAIHLMKKDHSAGERAYNKRLKPKDPLLANRAVEAYANLFKPIPRVTDSGIQAVLEDLASSTPVPKELIERPDYYRDNGPLEKIVASGWIEQLRK